MTDSPLQDIICCIGHPVSGNPAQYVLEQAISAASLDLRCLTFDVDPSRLADAMAGISAMKFRGALIADPHQSTVISCIDRLRDDSSIREYVDMVSYEDGELVGESLIGTVCLDLVREVFSSDKEVDADGETRLPESALILGSDRRAESIGHAFVQAGIAAELTKERPEPEVDEAKPTDSDAEPSPADATVIVRVDADDEQLPSLAAGTKLVIDLDPDPSQSKILRAAKEAGRSAFDTVDVQLRILNRAFSHWTSREADRQVMREALEEYLLV